MTPRRLGILGGTFDPIHCGHLDVLVAAQTALDLTRILVIPANIPPHRPQPVASSHHRFAMVALAITGHEGWLASDLELGINSLSFTTGTLQLLHDRGYPAAELFFIIGADAFAEIESWKDFPAILERAHFAVVSRPGLAAGTMPAKLPSLAHRMRHVPERFTEDSRTSIFLIDAVTSAVSSTAIRRDLAEGRPIAGLVPPGVRQYIEQHGLYSSSLEKNPSADEHRAPAAGRLHGQDR
jgi:nicotinate-nucleotide adenylyltransferase